MFENITFFGGHEFEKLIDEDIHTLCLQWAMVTARRKLNYTSDTWQDRNPNSKIMDILFGDYAKNLVKKYLLYKAPSLNIVEYDQIRTDEFLNADKFDIKINDFEIEIKSSLEKYSRNLEVINNRRNIIINRHESHITHSDFIFQVFYIPNDLRNFISLEELNSSNVTEFDEELFSQHCNLLALNNVDIYICGWIENDTSAIELFSVANNATAAESRSYVKMLIRNSHNPGEFLDLFEE